ncbi:MAG: 50S ribosomal protein L23 [Thermoprotei archaeon]|jgi:large subunit ribosomal protein L23
MGVILYPVLTEAAIAKLKKENRFTFVVDLKANKTQIKEEVEKLYGVKVESVKTLITPRGIKKAYVRLSKEYSAMELATKLGLL